MTIAVKNTTLDIETTAVIFDSLSIWQPLTSDECALLFSLGEVRRASEGEVLLEEEKNDTSLIILLAGRCEVRKTFSDRGLWQYKEVVLSERGHSIIFGDLSFLDQKPCYDTVLAKEVCYVWVLTHEQAERAFTQNPVLGLKFTQILARHLASQVRNHTDICNRPTNAENSIAYLNRNENPYFSDKVHQALSEAINSNINLYPHAYSENVIKKLSKKLGFPEDWLVVTPGSSIALDMTVRTFVKPNSHIVILSPTFEVFGFSATNLGATITQYCYPNPYEADIENFLASTPVDADVIYIANPNTPTGLYHTNDEIMQIANARPNSLMVIDEAYLEFTGNSAGITPLLRAYPNRFVIIRTMSKAWGLAGLRLGYVIGHPERLANFYKYLIPYSVNALSQIAACAILDEPAEVVQKHVEEINKQRDLLAKGLRDLGYRVEVGPTNFLLLFVKDALEAVKIFRRHDVIVRYVSSPNKLFFLGECVRISVGVPKETEKILAIAKDHLEN